MHKILGVFSVLLMFTGCSDNSETVDMKNLNGIWPKKAEQKTRQYNPEHRDGKRLLSADTVQHQYHHNIGEPQLYPRYSEIKRDQGFHIAAD